VSIAASGEGAEESPDARYGTLGVGQSAMILSQTSKAYGPLLRA
jgi:hypothetical protein